MRLTILWFDSPPAFVLISPLTCLPMEPLGLVQRSALICCFGMSMGLQVSRWHRAAHCYFLGLRPHCLCPADPSVLTCQHPILPTCFASTTFPGNLPVNDLGRQWRRSLLAFRSTVGKSCSVTLTKSFGLALSRHLQVASQV